MELALIRHGQTDWNLDERVQGRTDIPLNDTGRQQAREAGDRLRETDSDWDLVVSSPLLRTRETAEIIADALGAPLGGTYDDLIEQDFGQGEGMLVSEFYHRWPNRDFTDGEHDEALGIRGVGVLGRISEEHPRDHRILAVTHGSLIRGTVARLTGTPYLRVPRLANTSVSLFAHESDWRVLTIGGVPIAEALPAAV